MKIPLIVCALLTTGLFAQPKASSSRETATVREGNARFQVLTPHIIRMEWSATGEFEDRASLVFVQRDQSPPNFETYLEGGERVILLDAFELRYRPESGPFSEENLKVKFNHDGFEGSWAPGQSNEGNLLGTTRTLDRASGAIDLEQGLLSRDGWTLIDDSERPLFDDSDWAWVEPRAEGERQDLYLLMYGQDYKMILGEFVEVAGRIPMPPKFAFGYWWSRYSKYNEHTFRGLIDEFETHDVPLDVLVIDMDWHITDKPEWFEGEKRLNDQSGQPYGWTGYTWNKDVFPDPERFLAFMDERNLQISLNLHPASGIQPHEAVYPEFATAMGQDPALGEYVPFDITNKCFAETYFDLVIHPMEATGVDFWWLDWQQWSETNIPGVNPTFYLNYVHFSDMAREGKKRPLLFHRWGGLGNHRYQIGFSGDTHINWESLAFQPYFTMTASNVCYGYWSHDIGGHMHDDKQNAELYTRWLQWGAFSPILRTHSTKDKEIERRIWAYAPEYFQVMRDTIKLRYALLPYIYAHARIAYDTGVSILRPMYYEFPSDALAYDLEHQYYFGEDMIVSPVVHPMTEEGEAVSLTTTQKVWLPAGEWIEWSTGSLLDGGQLHERAMGLEDIPLYVRSGAIIPMQEAVNNTSESAADRRILTIFPGTEGATHLYDDEGNNDNYQKGAYTRTHVHWETSADGAIEVEIAPTVGSFSGMAEHRGYELRFPVSFPPKWVTINGVPCEEGASGEVGSWSYAGDAFETRIHTPRFPVDEAVSISLRFAGGDRKALSGKGKQIENLHKVAAVLNAESWRTFVRRGWETGPVDLDTINRLAMTGNRISMAPETIEAELADLERGLRSIVAIMEEEMDDFPEWRPYLDLLRLEY